MPPTLLAPSKPLLVKPQPLTPSTFAPFGTAITSPLPRGQSAIPKSSTLSTPLYPSHQPGLAIANQNTALKSSPISPLSNNYVDAPSHGHGKPLMSMFSCFPRHLDRDGSFEVKILERHPFTTQTFAPLGLAADDPDTHFLVIVAPSLSYSLPVTSESGNKVQMQGAPDLRNLKAFMAHGAQAITYRAGVWHAPMVVLGKARVDFLVTQFVSGVAEEDCQEVGIGVGVLVQVGAGRMWPKL
jgi:ureidoglycolate lyase